MLNSCTLLNCPSVCMFVCYVFIFSTFSLGSLGQVLSNRSSGSCMIWHLIFVNYNNSNFKYWTIQFNKIMSTTSIDLNNAQIWCLSKLNRLTYEIMCSNKEIDYVFHWPLKYLYCINLIFKEMLNIKKR